MLLTGAIVGTAPAVLWSLASLGTAVTSIFYRPVSFSFRLFSKTGDPLGAADYHELPELTALAIVADAALLLMGIASINRAS